MRILFIGESYLPQLCGMTAVTRYLAEGLVSRGHKVGIATQSHFDNDKNVEILNGVEINRFRIRRNLLKYPVGELKLFIDFVLRSEYDVYIFECIGSLTSDILMPYIDKIRGLKFFIRMVTGSKQCILLLYGRILSLLWVILIIT